METDQQRGRRLAQRWAIFFPPVFVIVATVLGYLWGRWLGALIAFVLVGTGAGLGAWISLKNLR